MDLFVSTNVITISPKFQRQNTTDTLVGRDRENIIYGIFVGINVWEFFSSSEKYIRIFADLNFSILRDPVYTSPNIVDDDLRVAFTRLRLTSHRLKVECVSAGREFKRNNM